MQMILLWFLNNINWQSTAFQKLIIRKQKEQAHGADDSQRPFIRNPLPPYVRWKIWVSIA